MTELPDPSAAIRADGPWTHLDIAANGCRFHVVEAGSGPMVMMLHGFPMFWWSWRHYLPLLADAGYHAVAMDLRGYGGSDHPPHGYDPLTLSADVAAVVRSLGESSAVVVGHGLGGLIAWTMGTVHPDVARAVVPVGMAHPARLRRAMLRDNAQRRAGWFAVGFQRPLLPERQLTAHDAERVGRFLHRWSGTPGWPDEDLVATYRAAMLVPGTAYGAVEFYRWAVRSIPRRDGRRFVTATAEPVTVPVLALHGTRDRAILPSTVDGSERYVSAAYQRVDLDCGHVVHEEVPDAFAAHLLPWLTELG
jgi:pimeloyl-ACP methyl ester carboxylesterase